MSALFTHNPPQTCYDVCNVPIHSLSLEAPTPRVLVSGGQDWHTVSLKRYESTPHCLHDTITSTSSCTIPIDSHVSENNGKIMVICNTIFKVQYPMHIEIRVQWTIHKTDCKFKQCDKYL